MTFYAVGTTKPSLSRNGTPSGHASSPFGDGVGTTVQMENNPYALALALVPLLTIFGNALVILAVCRDKSLRTVTNLLIMSLAISDLLVALCVMFFAVYYEWNSFFWDLGPTLCNLYIGADVACSTASILNLLAISIDRYIAISHPLAYCQIGTNSRAYVSIALVWGVSISVAIPLAFGANHIESEHECAFTNPVFMISSSVLSFFLPCLAMIALYAVVFRRLRERESARTARKRHAALSGTETALIANALMGGARMARQIARSHLKDQLLLELSIQTSSFPTASPSEEEEEDDEDEEEEAVDECQSDRDIGQRDHRRKHFVMAQPQRHHLQAEEEQQRRPTLNLMINGGMPFPMAPMNPLQLPSTALTEAERRVKGWRRKRTLRLMRRCNTLPSTVMQRQKTTQTTTAIVAQQQQQEQHANANASECHRHGHHREEMSPNRPKSALVHGTVANAVRQDANSVDERRVLLEQEQQQQNAVDGDDEREEEHGQQRQKYGDVPAERPREEGEGEMPWHSLGLTTDVPCSFGDEFKEYFPFIDQQSDQNEAHQSAFFPCGECSPPAAATEVQKLPCVLSITATVVESVDRPSLSNSVALKWHRHNEGNCALWKTTTTKQREKQCHEEKRCQCHEEKQYHGEKQCHGNGRGGIRRTNSERHPAANFAFRDWNEKLQLMRRLSAAAAVGRCTACAGSIAVAVVKNDENNNLNVNNYNNKNNNNNNNINNNNDADNNVIFITTTNNNNNYYYYNDNIGSGTAAPAVVGEQQRKSTARRQSAADAAYCPTKAKAADGHGLLALRNGGGVPFLRQRKQRNGKQCGGALLARFIRWTRAQRRVIAGHGGTMDGQRLVGVLESATTVGVISAVNQRNKSIGRGAGARRSVRISSRSPSERRKNNHNSQHGDNCFAGGTQTVVAKANNSNDGDGEDLSPEWNNDGIDNDGGESSAALSSSYRLLLDGTAANCCLAYEAEEEDTERRWNCYGSSVMAEQFSTAGRDGLWRNGTVPWRNGTGGCQRASTVTGVPKKTSCASSTFSSSPLRYIRQAFRRSLVPIIEEGRKPSRALLKRATRQMRREQKATVTLAVVLAVFLCCWVPFFALHLSNAVCLLSGGAQCVHLLAMFLSTWLGYLNSSLNPLIYTVFDKRFRKAFRNLLGCAAGPGSANDGRRGARPPRC